VSANGPVWRAGLGGAVAGLVVVTALKLARALPLMPVDWALAAWTGATTLGLVAALRRASGSAGAADGATLVSEPPSAITGLDHVQLAMPPGGEGEARSFYGGLLGLREVTKPAPLAARGGCWFEDERLRLHLGVEDPFQPARKAHPGLAVADLDALAAALSAGGARVRPASPELPGVRQAYVDDPFGNRIELVERRAIG